LNKTSTCLLEFIFASAFTAVGRLLAVTSIHIKSQRGVA